MICEKCGESFIERPDHDGKTRPYSYWLGDTMRVSTNKGKLLCSVCRWEK